MDCLFEGKTIKIWFYYKDKSRCNDLCYDYIYVGYYVQNLSEAKLVLASSFHYCILSRRCQCLF